MEREQRQKPKGRVNPMVPVVQPVSLLTEYDVYLFKEGNYFHLYEKFGSHPWTVDGMEGTCFAVWAPNAERVSVIGDFNGWDAVSHPLQVRKDGSGIWEGFIADVRPGNVYKYHVVSKYNRYEVDKGDPFAFSWELLPKTGSIVQDLRYDWKNQAWMASRQ